MEVPKRKFEYEILEWCKKHDWCKHVELNLYSTRLSLHTSDGVYYYFFNLADLMEWAGY